MCDGKLAIGGKWQYLQITCPDALPSERAISHSAIIITPVSSTYAEYFIK